MRGRKAKLIRHLAQRMTVGQPTVAHEWKNKRVVVKDEHGTVQRDAKGRPLTRMAYGLFLVSTCTRAVYQQVKKAYRNRPFTVGQ